MRIIAGRFKGHKLKTPENDSIRPTSDKIRGSVFNILNGLNVLNDAVVLDAFCGTGALGLEALSRGASACTFLDNAGTSLSIAKENARKCNIEKNCEFLKTNAMNLKSNRINGPFTLAFIDPPYNKNYAEPTLLNLHEEKLLTENAYIILETEKNEETRAPRCYQKTDERYYGQTRIQIFLYKTPE